MIQHTKQHYTQIALFTEFIVKFLHSNQIKVLSPCTSDPEVVILEALAKKCNLKIKLIQMHKIIIVNVIKVGGQYPVTVDQFWMNHSKYLKPKLHNTYILADIKEKQLLEKVIKERILSHALGIQKLKPLFFDAIYINLVLMNKLLRPKDFQNLISSNSSLYKAVNQQSEYKKLYEERWGRTGFELEEKNWIIAYQKKCQKKH